MSKKQPIKNNAFATNKIHKSVKKGVSPKNKGHKQKYGTSKLEADFAHEFLDKLGVKYIYEYEAKDIGRFYDFAVTAYGDIPFIMEDKNGIKCIKQEGQNIQISFCIEIDGGYFHSDPRVVNENKLSRMQKHNKFVDFLKDKWCESHGIPLLRIWEYDIRNNPKLVFEQLAKFVGEGDRKKRIAELKKKPH